MWSLGLDQSEDELSTSDVDTTCADEDPSHDKNKPSLDDAEEKFTALKRKRKDLYERSSAKRIKNVQQRAMKAVSDALQNGDDRELVEETGVRLPYLAHQKLSFRDPKRPAQQPITSEGKLHELTAHMGKTEHLLGLSMADLGGGGKGSSEMEKELELHLRQGNVAEASAVSDAIAERQLAIRIANAAKHRDAVKAKEKLQEEQRRKKHRLRWGFDSKQRWERKGNM